MDPYGLTLEDVKDVVIGCGLYISCERKPLPLGNKYIIEAKGQDGEYSQIILCSSDVAHENRAESFRDYQIEASHKKPINLDSDLFYSAIIRTKSLEDVLQKNGIHKIEEYKRVNELRERWNVEVVNNDNPLWYKIVIGFRSDTEPAPNTLDKESLKEAITRILGFGEIIGALVEEKQKQGELSEDYVDQLVERVTGK